MLFAGLAPLWAFAPTALAQITAGPSQPVITQPINEASLVVLSGNTRPEARNPANDRGIVPDDTPMAHMLLQRLILDDLKRQQPPALVIVDSQGEMLRKVQALDLFACTTRDFITGMAKHAKSTEFACYVRNYTANAVRLEIPFGVLEHAAKMTSAEQTQVVARNRERFATRPEPSRPAAAEPDSVSPADDWRS